MSVYIIAEAGINHDGCMHKALHMVEEAKEAGADAVKFQTYRTAKICSKSSDQYAWLKKCELPFSVFEKLNKAAKRLGIDFISTPDDKQCARFLAGLKPRWMKIGSAMARDKDFLRYCCNLGVPLIVSTGMMSWKDLWVHGIPCNEAAAIKATLQCTSSYPCPSADININVLRNNSDFRLAGESSILGLSDHTKGDIASLVAVGAGAQMLEKHFDIYPWTLGPDRAVSTENLFSYVRAIREAELMLGDGIKRLMPSEKKTQRILKARRKT